MLKGILGGLIVLLMVLPSTELNDQTYAQWRDHIRPKKEELSWTTIPWRPAFWSGVIEAQKQEKPLLVWAMNGHPLACT